MRNRIKIQKIVNSVYGSNTYVISIDGVDDGVWLVDCGDVDKIMDIIGGKQVQAVFFTHTHYDHMYGVNKLLDSFPNVIIYTNAFGKEALLSPKLNYSRYHQETEDIICHSPQNIIVLTDGQNIILNQDIQMMVRETPGHDESCITYILDNVVFSGDSYIPGVKVFANFLHSDKNKAQASLNLILELTEDRQLLPGHSIITQKKNRL